MVKFNFVKRAARGGLLKCPVYASRGFSVGLRGATITAPQKYIAENIVSLTT
jgi:hypothetical protein